MIRVSPMPKTAVPAEKNVRYRQRLRQAGAQEVLFQLPDETVALIDEIKTREGLRSRSLALLQLIERGRGAIQQTA
jgi:diphthamide synthase subunit DPH2